MRHKIDVGNVSLEAILSILYGTRPRFFTEVETRGIFFFHTKRKKDCSKIVTELVIKPESWRARES